MNAGMPSVLLVDDEPFQLKLLTRQFAHLGVVSPCACERAEEALARVSAGESFDLICCDLQMPEMDGVEFIRHLAGLGYRGALVLISGEDTRILATAERLAQAHALRVLGALHKPVTPEQLKFALDACEPVAQPTPNPSRVQYGADELRRAIGDGQLVLAYQPKVDFATGRVVGVEALVRWQHPRDGLVYPDHFISLAEEHQLIDALTREVLAGPRGALQQLRAWQDQGLQLQVAVNVSMDNLTSLSFPGFVVDEANRAGVAPSRLVLEITETRLMTDPLATLDILTRLRLKRVALAIDDFGTGHSSLSQLRDIPFDELKIDRGFVHGAEHSEAQRAIIAASLAMARQLNMRTVAEGIENEADWFYLRRAGCELAQGYFIARPMPPERLMSWLDEWESRRGALMA